MAMDAERQTFLAEQRAQWLNVEEAARVLRISKMKAYALVHQGKLKAFRDGRVIRVHLEDLRQLTL